MFEHALPKPKTILAAPLTDEEASALEALFAAQDRDPVFCVSSFRTIADQSGLQLEWAEDAVRALAGRGLAEFRHEIWTDKGLSEGSGYAITEVGRLIAEARRARAGAA